MLRFVSYDVVCSEIPGEVTLALNISNCPNRCKGCHSPHLWEDTGEELTPESLAVLLRQYGATVTCVCFMGGDADPMSVAALARMVRRYSVAQPAPSGMPPVEHPLKTAWYSGRSALPDGFPAADFQYIKLGPYVEALGGLKSPKTNQRLYRMEVDGRRTDLTPLFWRNPLDPESRAQ